MNTVLWDPTCTLLASCSDDHTAKVGQEGGRQAQPHTHD